MGNLYYYYTYYIIKVNNQKLANVKESSHGAKARIIKLAKGLDQSNHIEVIKIKEYMGASYVGEVVKKEVVWSN